MLPCLKDIKAALPNTPLAALPVGYTTNEENPTMQVPQRVCVCLELAHLATVYV